MKGNQIRNACAVATNLPAQYKNMFSHLPWNRSNNPVGVAAIALG